MVSINPEEEVLKMAKHHTTALMAATAVVAATLLGAGAANAQTTSGSARDKEDKRQNTRTPQAPQTRPTIGMFPGAMPNTGVGPIHTGAGAIPMNGQQQPVVITNPGYTWTPNNPNCPPPVYGGGYYYPGQTTVIINNPTPYGGVSTTYTPNIGTGYGNYAVPTQVTTTAITLFNGYATTWVNGQTVYAPYGSLYGCQPFLSNRYVVVAPYAYVNGQDLNVVRPWVDNDPYVTANGARAQGLRVALNDLTRYWEDDDVRGLRTHTSPDLSVAVFQNEKFAYSLRSRDFLDMSSDALDRINTTAFRFNDVRERNDGLVNAYATHRYRVRGTTEQKTATVRCTMVYLGGAWYLSAVSFSPGSLK
jgi:hypothetical protein